MAGVAIRVRGRVQGVGFRPFVWALAQEFALTGQVWNDADGLRIEAWGADLPGFAAALTARAPGLARVEAVDLSDLPGPPPPTFRIAPSRSVGVLAAQVTPDAATCPACLAEMRSPGRRQAYAFTTCTNCGPRFSIQTGLPWDRAQSTMAAFPMCPACRAEYDDPADRRFHAQPIACPECGPRLWFETGGTETPGDPIAQAAALLAQGHILAIKGLGGFHLACDAANPAALARLRARKHRPVKPFAVMAPLEHLSRVAHLTDADRQLLQDPAAPIVLVGSTQALPDAVAPHLTQLGVMLPATPLHHLLFDAFPGVLVMTSANLSGSPQAIDTATARRDLAALADGFLMHDRHIARRLDDGVERARPPMVLRRARGRAPDTLPLPPGFPPAEILALGGQMKSAICLVKGGHAILGPHLGDLDQAATRAAFDQALADAGRLFDHHPTRLACDLHPDYAATRAALALGLPVSRVQHHHAHLAACLGEALWPLDAGPVAGIILDGAGLGPDGTIWGGELLLGDYRAVTRKAHLRPAPLPGGDAAARQPWRNALMRLDQAGLSDWADALFADLPRGPLRAMAAAGVNAPLCSSAGRLFDALAACLGLCPAHQDYEAEAALRLEALAGTSDDATAYAFDMADGVIDPAPIWAAIRADLHLGLAPARIARRLHQGLALAFAQPARHLVESGQARAVVLSGGCLQNPILLAAFRAALSGLPVLTHATVPAGDGGLALGQALVALAQVAQAQAAQAQG